MTCRKIVCVLALLMVAPSWALAQVSTTTSSDTAGENVVSGVVDLDKPVGGRDAAIAVLRSRVDRVDWQDVTFEFVIDWLRDRGPINVITNNNALAVYGATQEAPVTLNMQNATVAEILNEVMDQLSEGGMVRYRAIGNTIRISTVDDFNRRLYVRVYDVTDLLMRVPDFDDAPEIDLQQTQTTSTGGGGGGQTVFSGGQGSGGDTGQESEQEFQRRLEELKKVIVETVAPTSWFEGGGQGICRSFNKMLVVRNSIEVHEEIGGLFSFGQ